MNGRFVDIIKRPSFLTRINYAFQVAPVCALLGPRQCGKTTISRAYEKIERGPIHKFDLEDSTDLARLENPKIALESLEGLIIIDEIQRRPELFPILRVLVDQPKERNFLILGSASQELIKQSSETLAGRISYIEMTPFQLNEVEEEQKLWIRGGFPKAFLSSNIEISFDRRKNFIRDFLEKDVPSLGFQSSPQLIRRFWNMLAHYHGQIFNASEIGGSLNISYKTVQHYLDILEGTFMIRRLNPWHENILKRQVKSPKTYFRDSGLLHTFLGIKSLEELQGHPKLGASWEGFALEEIIRTMKVDPEDCYFWATQNKAELDLLVIKDNKKIGFEFKYTDSPQLTRSMRISMEDLKLSELNVITPLNNTYFPLENNIFVYGLELYLKVLQTKIHTKIGEFYLDEVQWSEDGEELHCVYEELPKNRKIIEKFSYLTISDRFYNLKKEGGIDSKEDAKRIIKAIITNEEIFKNILISKTQEKHFSEKLNKEKNYSFNVTPDMFNNIDFRQNKIYS